MNLKCYFLRDIFYYDQLVSLFKFFYTASFVVIVRGFFLGGRGCDCMCAITGMSSSEDSLGYSGLKGLPS